MTRLLPFLILLSTHLHSLEVSFFPDAFSQGKRETFVLTSESDKPIVAKLNEVELATEIPSAEGAVEFALSFDHGGSLTFEQGEEKVEFRLLTPEYDADLEQVDGFLYTGGVPAILLPRESARYTGRLGWEVLGVIGSLIEWHQAPKEGVLLLAREEIGEGHPTEWRRLRPSKGVFEIKGAIAAFDTYERSEWLVVALSGDDLERGMRRESFDAHLRWLLQRATVRGVQERALVTLPLSPLQQERFPLVTRDMRLAAESCKARFIAVRADEKNWANAVTSGLKNKAIQ